jgi:hypothetical protein
MQTNSFPKTERQAFRKGTRKAEEITKYASKKVPKYGAQKNIGKFSSVKTGRVTWYGSLLERDYWKP